MCTPKKRKRRFLLEYYGSYPPTIQDVRLAAEDGDLDIDGILTITQLNRRQHVSKQRKS
jgi:hypothetical protein